MEFGKSIFEVYKIINRVASVVQCSYIITNNQYQVVKIFCNHSNTKRLNYSIYNV